jgi:replicative DNA helicase
MMAQQQLQQPQAAQLGRVPPQNLEAEMALIGSMLLGQEAVAQALDVVDAQAFYKAAHRMIFEAMVRLYNENEPADLVTVSDALTKQHQLDRVGGASYLAELASNVPTTAHAAHYGKIVKEKYVLRQLIESSTQIVTDGYAGQIDAAVLLDQAERSIFEIAERGVKREIVPVKDIIKSSIETIDNLYQRKGLITGLPTGFDDLDQMTAGFHPADLVIVAGRPSMGKSAFALNVVENLAIQDRVGVAVFSLEMSSEHLVQRMLCSHARINAHNVRRGILGKEDWGHLTAAAGKLSDVPIFLDDSSSLTMFELRSKARRLKARHDIGLIVVDYLQLMEERSIRDNRQQEISMISRNLKALARELNVAVVAISQLSRAPERRESFRPRLSDLRESGSIEQDADLVLLLFREEYYQPTEDNKGQAEIIIAKQRHGPVGTLRTAFLKEYVRFENLASRSEIS